MVFSLLKSKPKQAQGAEGEVSGSLVAALDPSSAAAEDYRTLRTNLFYTLVDMPPKVIMMTSPRPREGKSTTCANLGVVLAQADKKVLLMDCDLRKPVMHRLFGMHNLRGLVDVLAGACELNEILRESKVGPKVATAGPVPPNPTELLSSNRFAEILAQVRQEFDYVLIDAPPVGLVSDPAILATKSDGVLLVLDAQNTRKGAVREAMRSLEAVGAHVLGTVMNNVNISRRTYARYQSYTYG